MPWTSHKKGTGRRRLPLGTQLPHPRHTCVLRQSGGANSVAGCFSGVISHTPVSRPYVERILRWPLRLTQIECDLACLQQLSTASALPVCPSHGSCLRPLDGERVDFLGADVAGEDRGAIRCDIDLSLPIHHPSKAFQTGDGFDLTVGESNTLHLGFRTAGGEVEILAIRRDIPVHEVAGDKVAPFLGFEVESQQLRVVFS